MCAEPHEWPQTTHAEQPSRAAQAARGAGGDVAAPTVLSTCSDGSTLMISALGLDIKVPRSNAVSPWPSTHTVPPRVSCSCGEGGSIDDGTGCGISGESGGGSTSTGGGGDGGGIGPKVGRERGRARDKKLCCEREGGSKNLLHGRRKLGQPTTYTVSHGQSILEASRL